MATDTRWQPFGIPDEYYDEDAPRRPGQRILNVTFRRPKSGQNTERTADPAATWLRSALIGLGVLATAAAAVSFAAQYALVVAAKGVPWVAALEAAIPDAGAVVFACLGIALALKGKRALRARGGNLACVGLSLTMNLLAAHAGWRGIAIWVMPSAVYTFASDTLIGVIRAYVLAKLGETDDGRTVLDIFGGLLLWVLRLTLAPASTLTGFRSWVLTCPVAPGRLAEVAAPDVPALPAAVPPGSAGIPLADPEPEAQVKDTGRAASRRPRAESKTAAFLALVEDRHGELAGIDPAKVARIAADLAPEVGLDVGAARSALRPRVLAAQAGGVS